MIHSFTVKRAGERWVASGACSLGPINRSGATRDEAIQLAKLQIKGYVSAYAAKRYVECVGRKPGYFLRKMA